MHLSNIMTDNSHSIIILPNILGKIFGKFKQVAQDTVLLVGKDGKTKSYSTFHIETMSYFFEHGLGVEQNEYLAYLWTKIAADNVSEIAFDRLPELMAYSEM